MPLARPAALATALVLAAAGAARGQAPAPLFGPEQEAALRRADPDLDRRVRLDLVDAPREEVLAELGDRCGVRIRIAPGLELPERLTVDGGDAPAERALEALARAAGAERTREGPLVLLHPPGWTPTPGAGPGGWSLWALEARLLGARGVRARETAARGLFAAGPDGVAVLERALADPDPAARDAVYDTAVAAGPPGARLLVDTRARSASGSPRPRARRPSRSRRSWPGPETRRPRLRSERPGTVAGTSTPTPSPSGCSATGPRRAGTSSTPSWPTTGPAPATGSAGAGSPTSWRRSTTPWTCSTTGPALRDEIAAALGGRPRAGRPPRGGR